jgi:cholesterol oxidase
MPSSFLDGNQSVPSTSNRFLTPPANSEHSLPQISPHPCGSNSCANQSASINRREILTAGVTLVAGAAMSPGIAMADGRGGRPKPMRNRSYTCDTPLKQRAASDYEASLHHYGGRLANPIRQLFTTTENQSVLHFGVVIIGSGYGASIVAARLSQHLRNDLRICILERGKEWVPGTFPDKLPDLFKNATTSLTGPTQGQRIHPLGVYEISMNDEVNILSGNGLGGGSLINASVALRPHPEVFERCEWPHALRSMDVLAPYYDQVAASVSLSRTPLDQTAKVRIRRQAAECMSANPDFLDRSPLSVMYDYRHLDQRMRNPQGMIQRPCTLCGCCITGCNIGAKNTLTMNYLPVAKHNGTEMFTQVEVKKIEKRSGYYCIHAEYVDDSEDIITRHSVAINTKMIVVGAGSPASAAILLESQNEQFQFSPALGKFWSGNGDTIGFVIDLPPGTQIGGFGAYPSPCAPVGPTVQTSLNFYRDIELRKRLLIQDAAIPRGAGNLFSFLLQDTELTRSMVMLGMGHDGEGGRIEKRNGRYQIKWEGMKESPYRKMVFQEFERLAQAHGGKYKRLKAFGNNLVTVHPLGGCRMSDDPDCGTTNQLGQVYDGQGCDCLGVPSVHHGLYVADASVIPTALGVNPYMTIGAISERIAHHIVNNPIHADLFQNAVSP